tara:strand:+ start:172 stop:636 length:465 start_codon:yes stop_codon:yes gene_type:complete
MNKRDVKGYKGYYVTDCGLVFGKRKETSLVPTDCRGHLSVIICNSKTDRLRTYVHRLVWTTFVGDIPEGFIIDHINGVRGDNRLSNLQCITQSQNLRKGSRSIYDLPEYVSINKKKGNRKDAYTYRRKVNNKRVTLKTSTNLDVILEFAKNYED